MGGWGGGYAGANISELCYNLEKTLESYGAKEKKAKISIESKFLKNKKDYFNGILDNRELEIIENSLSKEGFQVNVKYWSFYD